MPKFSGMATKITKPRPTPDAESAEPLGDGVTRPAGVALPPAVASASPPKLLPRLRDALRLRHYSIRTEQAYVDWVRRFVVFHGRRHPARLGASEVQAFLTHLAVERSVSSSTS